MVPNRKERKEGREGGREGRRARTFVGDGLGHEGLAATGGAVEEHAAGGRHAELHELREGGSEGRREGGREGKYAIERGDASVISEGRRKREREEGREEGKAGWLAGWMDGRRK